MQIELRPITSIRPDEGKPLRTSSSLIMPSLLIKVLKQCDVSLFELVTTPADLTPLVLIWKNDSNTNLEISVKTNQQNSLSRDNNESG